jgi:hypothetical protein
MKREDWEGIFGNLVRHPVGFGSITPKDLQPANNKVVPIRKKEAGHTWLGHGCACFEYWIRDDDVVICSKCEAEVGYFVHK